MIMSLDRAVSAQSTLLIDPSPRRNDGSGREHAEGGDHHSDDDDRGDDEAGGDNGGDD